MKDQIEKLKAELRRLEAEGSESVSISTAIAQLDGLAQQQTFYPLNVAYGTEMFKATKAAGEFAVKSAMLVASGGTAALLALFGYLVTSSDSDVTELLLTGISDAILCFGVAFVLVAVTAGLRYLSRMSYSSQFDADLVRDAARGKKAKRWGGSFRVMCIVLMALTVPLFAAGGWKFYSGLHAQAAALEQTDNADDESDSSTGCKAPTGQGFL